MSINNKIMDALGEQGYTGSINERIQANLFDLYGTTNINVGLSKAGGFKKYFEDNFLGVVNYVAQLDGATQYWQLSEEIPLPVGYSYEMDVLYEASNLSENDYLATGEGDTNSPLFFVNREFLDSGSAGRLSTPSVDGGGNKLPYDGAFHTISVTSLNNSASVGILGARFSYTRNSSGIISMFRVRNSSGVVVNEIPLTNKAQGATQIATVGSVNATMINYTGDEWEQSS